MGDPTCDAVSVPEGFTCARSLGHLETSHHADDVFWSETGPAPKLCRAVTDEPGPLPSRCNRTPDHAGDHTSTEHTRVLHQWSH